MLKKNGTLLLCIILIQSPSGLCIKAKMRLHLTVIMSGKNSHHTVDLSSFIQFVLLSQVWLQDELWLQDKLWLWIQ